ncbi:DUF447 domain-containing protein [Haloplanus halophilus]|uniref:DUF447 domain-containing protein n=1 Tax=Haloplanus halophilus TaxID=2949993 RepID=UPI00203EAD4D|nr:DUF447 domain-containing protein [Haloplanus sp. GDY1]
MSGADWPVSLRGVTESVVATLGPNGRWNQAALGLHAPDDAGEPVTATTWGRTRTRGNFERRGGGVVQFTTDPREFVDAALDVTETDDPVREGAAAWVEVTVERLDAGEEGGTEWVRWALSPVESAVREESVPTIDRGFAAVVDATVAASRLDVPAYDTATLLDRLAYFAETVDRCGGPAERAAFARIDDLTGWRERRNESL